MIANSVGQGNLETNRQKQSMMRVAKFDATKGKIVYEDVSGRVVLETDLQQRFYVSVGGEGRY